MSKAPPARKPMTSGFWNPTLPRTRAYDPHQNCRGCDCTAPHCPCTGHRCDGPACTAPPPHEEPPVTVPSAVAQPSSSTGETTDLLGALQQSIDRARAARADPPTEPVPVTEPAPTDPQTEPEPEAPGPVEEPLDLTTAAEVYRAAAAQLQNALTSAAMAATGWQDAVRIMRRIEAGTWDAREVHSSLAQHVYLTGEHGQQQVEGVPGMVMIGRGRERKSWDHTGVAQDYVAAKIEATGGEMPDPGQVVEWVLETAAPSYWRVTPLREAGLDPEDYCTSEPGNVSVSIPKEDRLG